MDLKKSLGVTEETAEVVIGHNPEVGDDAIVYVRYAGSEKGRKAVEKAQNRHFSEISKSQRSKKPVPEEVDQAFTLDAFAFGLIADWKNITDQGKALDCTDENIREVMADDEDANMHAVRRMILDVANDDTAFQAHQEREEGKGSSESGSNGKQSTESKGSGS